MKKNRKRWLQAVAAIVLVIVVIYGAIGVIVYSSIGGYPVTGAYPPPHIRDLVWPTVGFPEFAGDGATMSAEVLAHGLTAREAGTTLEATITASRPELKGLSYTMPARTVSSGKSAHWPRGTGHGRDTVLLATFQVPAGAVPELYDLSVDWQAGGKPMSDSQQHAVSIVEPGRQEDFSFVSLSDVHVHQRNVSGFMFQQTNKGIAPDGRPLFFERAIDQVNLLRPDFAVILGDNILAQHSPGEYLPEFKWFYAELARFQVPVFVLPGNHDSYINGVDGKKMFEMNLGPLYYSFDFGGAHFAAADTNQWLASDRRVMEKLGLIAYPRKWQGQVLASGDERKPQTYTGELAWLRDDLAAHPLASLKFMMMHHDPYRPGGRAISWRNERFAGVYALGGGGVGSTALKELASRYRVDYVLTGHLHSDYIGQEKWRNKQGQTVFANQTMVYFDEGGLKDSYPGFRTWRVKDGNASGYTYLDSFHSTPIYDGCNLKGNTDLGLLNTLALSGGASASGFSVRSYLGVPVQLRGLVGVFPTGASSGSPDAKVYRRVPIPGDPSKVMLYLSTDLPAGRPGPDPTTPGVAGSVSVPVR